MSIKIIKKEKQKKNLKKLVKKDTKKCLSEQDKGKTKGLSVAIDNEAFKGYTEPIEKNGKGFKMKQMGRLFTLLAWNKFNYLNGYHEWELVADILGLNLNVNFNRLKSDTRKALNELYPTIEYKEDAERGIKFTHIPKGSNFGMYIEEGETKGFTQLYCDLAQLENRDLMVVHTTLEYFKGSNKEVYPSLNEIAKYSGCKRDKINKLLKEGKELGLWDIESTKGGSKSNTNKYYLSYINEYGQERYHYLDYIEGLQEEMKEVSHNV